MPKMQLVDYDFHDGLNVDADSEQIKKSELIDSYEAQAEQLIEWPRDDGTITLLAIIGTNLCELDSDFSVSKTVQALNSTRIPYFFLQDKLYFIDPGTEYYVYDGTNCNAVTPDSDPDNDLTPIKRCKYIVRHPKSMRIFFAGDTQDQSAVYYSEYNQPDFVKDTSVLYPTNGDGPVKVLSMFMDAVLVEYKYSRWIWRGIDPEEDSIWEKLPTSAGTIAPYSVALTTSSLTSLGPGGIYTITPSIIGISMEIRVDRDYIANIAQNKVMEIINAITSPEIAVSVFDNINQRFMLAYCDDDTERNNKILVVDWLMGGFTRWTGIKVNDFLLRLNGDLLAATENYILKLNTGDKDISTDGTEAAIDFDIETPSYDFDSPFEDKNVSKYFISYKNETGLAFEVDYKVDDEVKETEEISASGTADLNVARIVTSYTGARHRLNIKHSQVDVPFAVYGIGFNFKMVNTIGDKL